MFGIYLLVTIDTSVYFRTDGFADIFRGNTLNVPMKYNRNDTWGVAHTHWAKANQDWVNIGGNNSQYVRYDSSQSYPAGSIVETTVGGYHSPGDLLIPDFNIVVGRSTSSFSYGIGSYNMINPDPFIRFFLFNF